jgi:hypothetical protein
LAAVLFVSFSDWTWIRGVFAALSLILGAAAIDVLLPFFRRRGDAARLAESRRIALAWIAAHPRSPGGRTQLVVWNRAGCAACLFYEAVHRPALLEELEGAIALEEIDAAGLAIQTPLILILGTSAVLFLGLTGAEDDHERLRSAIARANDPALEGLQPPGGIYLA